MQNIRNYIVLMMKLNASDVSKFLKVIRQITWVVETILLPDFEASFSV